MRLGVSTYSYWHFRGERYPVEKVMEQAANLGLAGVEILHMQMESEEPVYLRELKRTAFSLGLDIYCLAIHQDFVQPDPEERKRHIDHTKHCLQIAYELGIPAIRLNSGRWKTVPSFDELMKRGGIEPPIEGYTEADAFGWVIGAIENCLPDAERYGIVLALENHWGLTATAEGTLKIVNSLNSQWLKVCLDIGNLLRYENGQVLWEPDYEGMAQLASHAILVHAKTYFGGGEWYTLDIDYRRVGEILRQVNYQGYISLEYEGKEDPQTGVPKSIDLLREAFKL
ncbi:MAG: sugar phosphate isomerase/epimerase [Armatimonadetes bacterium]|nr:sugar phosphate isomerase/epimerase [Armatimonadota bacterium]MDW8028490.1 sugar phosphate isomerase/epimerase family protein [Armatimonadota bacterium]